MKKSLYIRILAALGGLTLWTFGGLAVAETFFHVPVTAAIGKVLGSRTPLMVLVTLLAAIVLFALGLCCLMMLSGKRAIKRKGFVMQKSENGMIGVSVKSIEGLVQTCVKQNDTIAKADIAVVERRDGIVILLNVEEAAGVNIPLAVGALQKQIKEYVGTCTGVDVQEVRVMVENTEDEAEESPYAVQKPMALTAPAAEKSAEEPATAEVPMETPAVADIPAETVEAEDAPEEELAPVSEEEPAVQESAPAVAVPVMPVMPEMIEEEDDRPLHQRLFGAEEQPVFVPAPPELVIEPQAEESVGEPAAEAVDEPAEEAAESGEIDANAVLEVVEAIAEEEVIPETILEVAAEENEPAAEEAPAWEVPAEEAVEETEINVEPEEEARE